MGKLGTVSPVQETGSEFLVNIRTQKENKWVDFGFGPITAKLTAVSQSLYLIETENSTFNISTLRMRMVELYYRKVKGESGGTS